MINLDKEILADLILDSDSAEIKDISATNDEIFIITESLKGLKRYSITIENITKSDIV